MSRGSGSVRPLLPRRIAGGATLALTLGLVIHTPVSAQRETDGQQRSGWLAPDVGPIDGLTAAQRAEAIETLGRIERILRQVPELANPDGFEIRPVILGGAVQEGPGGLSMAGSVVEYILNLMFYVPSRAAAGEGCDCIQVRVNPIQSGGMYDAQGRLIYIEPPRAAEPRGPADETAGILWQVPAATRVYGELWEPSRDLWYGGVAQRSIVDVLFEPRGESAWRPVTREEFYEASLFELEGASGERQAEYRESLEKTPYQVWMEGAAERTRNREQQLAEAAKYQSAAEVQQLRELLERTDREVTENLLASEAGDRERNAEGLSVSLGLRDSLLVELERMSPAERAMPAYIGGSGDGPRAAGWGLTADSMPPSWRVLTPDYDFWRARRSPVEVRSINVHIGIAGTGLHPGVRNALLATFRTLDWAAFNQLLDAPRPAGSGGHKDSGQ